MKSEMNLEKAKLEVEKKMVEMEEDRKKLELKDRKLDFIDNLAIGLSFISIIAYFVILELGNFNGL